MEMMDSWRSVDIDVDADAEDSPADCDVTDS